jgi:hypothetical protein
MYTGLRHFPARHVSVQLHPHCTSGPSPCIYKREVQAPPARGRSEGRARERADEQAHSLPPSRALVIPTTSASPWRRITQAAFSPLCSISRQPIWAGTCSDNFTRRSRDPSGSKRRQLARQVGACCLLTNNFPLSSRWVASSNLFSPGRCSASGASSSCPSMAATTWYSFPAARQRQRRPTARRWRRTRRRLPPVAEEQHLGLSRHPPRRRRRRRGNHGQAGGGISSPVKRVDDAGTPAGDMSGVVLAPETMTNVVSPQRANPKRIDGAGTLAKGLLGVSLVPEITVQSVPDATLPPSIDQEVPSVFHPMPFRFSFDPPSDPASVSAFVKAYPNLLGYHM